MEAKEKTELVNKFFKSFDEFVLSQKLEMFFNIRKQFTDEDWYLLDCIVRSALEDKKEALTKDVELTSDEFDKCLELAKKRLNN